MAAVEEPFSRPPLTVPTPPFRDFPETFVNPGGEPVVGWNRALARGTGRFHTGGGPPWFRQVHFRGANSKAASM